MKRTELLLLIEASLAADRPDYTQALAQSWLAHRHNDLSVRFGLARAFAAQQQLELAHQILAELAAVDPENALVQLYLGQLSQTLGLHDTATAALAAVHVLTGHGWPAAKTPPPWLAELRQAWIALEQGQGEQAHALAANLNPTDLPTPLAALVVLQVPWRAKEYHTAQALAQAFHNHWPDSVAIMLCQADGLLHMGDDSWGVAWLHEASALDPAGEVIQRYWGREHAYRDLWPAPIDISLPVEIPPEVAVLLSSNRLTGPTVPSSPAAPKSSAPKTPPLSEELRNIEAELRRVQRNLNHYRRPRKKSAGKSGRAYRRPVHVILSSRKRLQAKFGPKSSAEILQMLAKLARTTHKQRGYLTQVVLVDDAETLADDNLQPVDPTRAWDIKNLLVDLDRMLTRRGQAIGSLLIVGGDDIIPFHRLPNPVDDSDSDVPSDNPYGSLDDNYFIPEWPVGRLPSPCGRDPQPLLTLLRNTIAAHRQTYPKPTWLRYWLRLLFSWRHKANSVGYSADIWRDPSMAVFRQIGRRRQFFTSPPHTAPNVPERIHAPHQLSYYNLHGLEESPDWYGQQSGILGGLEDMFPVALRPADVSNGTAHAPNVVFTEACYGANILDKSEPDAALCLRFLAAGTQALVGSTKIAYGSVTMPLIGADLLGSYFWRMLLAGHPLGEALRRARLALAKSMHRRQGYLDGEDQKTLISFVLYGDPSLPAPGSLHTHAAQGKSLRRKRSQPKTLTSKGARPLRDEETAAAAPIRAMIAQYLPGMETGQIRVIYPHQANSANAKLLQTDPKQRVYAITKSVQIDNYDTQKYARVTVNGQGEIVKLSVSK